MFDTSDYFPPTAVSEESVRKFSNALEVHLGGAITLRSALSDDTMQHVRRSVAPSAMATYNGYPAIVSLLAFEVGEIGRRIRRYQYIERYKFFTKTFEREMAQAFGEHAYEMRAAQIYSVLERGSQIIRFCASVAQNLGLGDSTAANRFAKRFRKEFERRLRERHRQAHAHERPSLPSRVLSLRPEGAEERRAAVQALAEVLGKAREALRLLDERFGPSPNPMPSDPGEFQRWYLSKVDGEAAEMWRLFQRAISEAADLPEAEDTP